MRRLLVLAAMHPWSVLSVLVLVSLAAASQLPKIKVDVSPQSLTMRGDPARVFYERSVATFGTDDITVIFIRDDGLFERPGLAAVKQMVDAVEGLPFVARTESLFSVPNLKAVDEFVKTDPYLHKLPRNPSEAEQLPCISCPAIRARPSSFTGRRCATPSCGIICSPRAGPRWPLTRTFNLIVISVLFVNLRAGVAGNETAGPRLRALAEHCAVLSPGCSAVVQESAYADQ
jgi:hypothetical protein